MERTVRHDVLFVLGMLAGAGVAVLLFGADPAILEGYGIGAVVVVVGFGLIRFVARHAGTGSGERRVRPGRRD
jgi:hypothetical protein